VEALNLRGLHAPLREALARRERSSRGSTKRAALEVDLREKGIAIAGRHRAKAIACSSRNCARPQARAS
jgi:hypothetical protein